LAAKRWCPTTGCDQWGRQNENDRTREDEKDQANSGEKKRLTSCPPEGEFGQRVALENALVGKVTRVTTPAEGDGEKESGLSLSKKGGRPLEKREKTEGA